mgnify:CR=1 FL=1
MTEEELKKEIELLARQNKARRQKEAREAASKLTTSIKAQYGPIPSNLRP